MGRKLGSETVLNSSVFNIRAPSRFIANMEFRKASTLTHLRVHSLLLSLLVRAGACLWCNGHFHGNKPWQCLEAWAFFDGE